MADWPAHERTQAVRENMTRHVPHDAVAPIRPLLQAQPWQAHPVAMETRPEGTRALVEELWPRAQDPLQKRVPRILPRV